MEAMEWRDREPFAQHLQKCVPNCKRYHTYTRIQRKPRGNTEMICKACEYHFCKGLA